MKQLQTIDADTLLSTPLPLTKFIVEGLLPEGLHILAGSPKVGKSWLALWICLQVSKGDSVWGLPTTPGAVLYLCLEDSYTRIQNRLFQLTDDAPSTLHFANLSGSIGDGLENQISSFLSEFLKRLHSFTGTATELSALLEHETGETISPSVLSKKLVKHASGLDKFGIHISSNRTRDARQLCIECDACDSSDGSDGKNG